ncbi:MAG TPA: DoxX family protein [Bryobacteraceae bacterium]|nr:DoxX family protein [Bryobacteraceae bacterium]
MHKKSKLTYVLWSVQVLLALLFLMAGGVKLVMPVELMVKQTGLPGGFLHFVSVCEVLGGFGLVLPGLLRLWTGLTPLAATGLVGIMIGAVTVTAKTMGAGPALFPLITGLLAAFVAYGRWRLAPLPSRTSSTAGSTYQSVQTGT